MVVLEGMTADAWPDEIYSLGTVVEGVAKAEDNISANPRSPSAR